MTQFPLDGALGFCVCALLVAQMCSGSAQIEISLNLRRFLTVILIPLFGYLTFQKIYPQYVVSLGRSVSPTTLKNACEINSKDLRACITFAKAAISNREVDLCIDGLSEQLKVHPNFYIWPFEIIRIGVSEI